MTLADYKASSESAGGSQSHSTDPWSRVWHYAMAVGMVGMATLLTVWLTRPRDWLYGEVSPLFFAAVMISAWFGGIGPGLLATVLAGFASVFFFIEYPAGSPAFDLADVLRLCLFLMVALLTSFLALTRKRAEAALRKSLEELEQRVQNRTAELKISNDRLRESEERFRLLVEGVADYAIVMLDSTGKIVSWNSGAERIHGYGPEQIIGQYFGIFFPRDEMAQEMPARHLQEAAARSRHEDEGWRIRKDATPFWASVITTALRDEGGQLRGFAQVTRDITELRRLEREVLDISEQEQRRLGHDLHDGLGQELTGLAFLSQNLEHKLAGKSLPEAAEARRIQELTNRALEQTRELARGFSPVELGPDGLATALGELAATVQSVFKVACSLDSDAAVVLPSDAAALHLYRIAQEAVNNAVRHAKPAAIRISLKGVKHDTLLRIEDDGVGLGPEESRGRGMGIRLMLYRAHAIGATLEIRPGRSGGTEIVCRLAGPEAFETIGQDDQTEEEEHDSQAQNR